MTKSKYAIIEADSLLGTDSLVWIDGRWNHASRHEAVLRHAERLLRFKPSIKINGYTYRGRFYPLSLDQAN